MWEAPSSTSHGNSSPAPSSSSSSRLMVDATHDASAHDDEDAGQDSFLGRWEADEDEQSWEAPATAESAPLPVVRKQYVIKPRPSFMSSTSSSEYGSTRLERGYY